MVSSTRIPLSYVQDWARLAVKKIGDDEIKKEGEGDDEEHEQEDEEEEDGDDIEQINRRK
jgi:hypothetical protein